MNSDQLQGKWKQVKGSVKERWGKLTDDDIDVIDGRQDQLVGTIQERYGIAREVAEKQVKEWNAALDRTVDNESDTDQIRDIERRRAS
ncbi:MAG TPA: CsbD family protein [Terriglobales bacterium]|nr:CsbD family protein [Terriglobales bacterium]